MKVKEEQLIDLISKEVIRQLEEAKLKINLEKVSILVLGEIELLKECDYEKYNYYTLEDYIKDGDIERYQDIIITKIGNYELCDIALGRDVTPFTSAVQKAFLLGKNVYLMQEALVFRNFKEKSNPMFYNLLEEYVNTIEAFGIIILNKDSENIKEKSEKTLKLKPIYDSTEKIITESIAKNICKETKKCIDFPKGTILTPLAKDIFIAANKEFTLD